MASSLPSSFHALRRTTLSGKARMSLRPKAQRSGDEGKSSVSIVDANMGVLGERMEMVRVRERLQRRTSRNEGWYYVKEYNPKLKKDARFAESLEVAELVLGTFGLTIVSCTLCLCLISFAAHLG